MSRFSLDQALSVLTGGDNDLADDDDDPYWISVRPGERTDDDVQHASIVLTPASDKNAAETFDVTITRRES